MMAYFGSSYYEAEPGVFLPNPYGGSYDYAPTQQALIPYSGHEFNRPSFIQYDPSPCVGACDWLPSPTQSVISYSLSNVSQSQVVVYDPATYGGGGYDPFPTQFTISYNVSEFNVPDFEEYDPTPYGGGYDIAETYGKPLPPSDEICYPREAPQAQAMAPPSDPLPEEVAGHDSAAEPQKGGQPTKASEEEQEPNGGTADVLKSGSGNGDGSAGAEPLESSQNGEIERINHDDYYPWSVYGYDYRNGRGEEQGCEKQVTEDPWGYSPEAMAFCESIFGHWPCLSRRKMRESYGPQGIASEESNSNQWKGTAEFLFGSSYTYTQ